MGLLPWSHSMYLVRWGLVPVCLSLAPLRRCFLLVIPRQFLPGSPASRNVLYRSCPPTLAPSRESASYGLDLGLQRYGQVFAK